ncbi:hypothetical protein ACFQPF_03795 [Fictibacillus iocasae]|uniref:Uncharacterized protein n=1 Tax=Fictibacillus iocasae TaxID=2715437 RepID=A0ABW2NJY0_9BACL
MMTKVKLPMPAGLILERAAAAGLKGADLADAVRDQNRSAFKEAGISEESIDYILEFGAQNQEVWDSAVYHGYVFKFLSIRGLQNFLIARLGLKEGEDFVFYETFLDSVRIPADSLSSLKETVPGNWMFTVIGNRGIYRIEHVTASAGASAVSKN